MAIRLLISDHGHNLIPIRSFRLMFLWLVSFTVGTYLQFWKILCSKYPSVSSVLVTGVRGPKVLWLSVRNHEISGTSQDSSLSPDNTFRFMKCAVVRLIFQWQFEIHRPQYFQFFDSSFGKLFTSHKWCHIIFSVEVFWRFQYEGAMLVLCDEVRSRDAVDMSGYVKDCPHPTSLRWWKGCGGWRQRPFGCSTKAGRNQCQPWWLGYGRLLLKKGSVGFWDITIFGFKNDFLHSVKKHRGQSISRY